MSHDCASLCLCGDEEENQTHVWNIHLEVQCWEDLALCVEHVKRELRIQSHPPSLTSDPAVHKPDVLIKTSLKETNQLLAPVHDDLFYLTHGRLLMSTM